MEILERGILHHVKNQKIYPYEIKILGEHYLAELIELQNIVTHTMANPELFYPLSVEEMTVIFNGEGIIIGTFVENELIGFRTIFFPQLHNENLGYDFEFETSELFKVVHFEISCIHPDYRGNKIQQKMGALLLKEIQRIGGFIHLCTTVHPENYASLKDKFHHQMVVRKLAIKYDSKIRYILYRNLASSISIDLATTKEVLATHLDTQKELLQQGYVGYQITEKNNHVYLLLGKLTTNDKETGTKIF